MDTLLDYVKWMGKYDFAACPLRDADVLVLCVVSYFDLAPVFSDGRSAAHLRECLEAAEKGEIKLQITGGDLGNRELFLAAVRSHRFGDLIVSDYTDILEKEQAVQFSAMTFHDSRNFHFIAYRGTDSSLAGWKENFMISFTRTRAQELAAQYAARLLEALPEDPGEPSWYIAGHSKGGNLALYAACQLSDEALGKVRRVYSLDGPGFCPEVTDPSLISRIDSVTTRIIPEFDFVGMLFEPKITDTRIVMSFRDGIVQHSLPSWLLDHGELTVCERNSPLSLRLNEVMDAWIESRSMEDRKSFVDELFDVLARDGVTDLSDLTAQKFADVLMHLRDVSDSTKETLADLRRRALLGESARPGGIFENLLPETVRGKAAEIAEGITGEKPGERTGERTAEESWEQAGERTAEESWEQTGERTAEKPWEQAVERSAEKSGKETQEGQEEYLQDELREETSVQMSGVPYVPDVKERKAKSRLLYRFPEVLRLPGFLEGLVMIPAGLIVSLASENIIDIVCLLAVISITLFQLALTVRTLKKDGWQVANHRESIYFSIVLIALTTAMFIKDQAMFIFGSIIAGILLLVTAYHAGERAAKKSEGRILRLLNLAECIFAVIFGFSMLFIHREGIAGNALALGIALIADGVARVCYILWRRRHPDRPL